MRRLLVAAAVLLGMASCASGDGGEGEGGGVPGSGLSLVTTDCTGAESLSLTDDVSELVIAISGPDMEPVELRAATSAGTPDLGKIPAGVERVLTVSALKDGVLVASGRSAPFQVVGRALPLVVVTLRAVNRFSPTADPFNACTLLMQPRAGHSAAILPDGRILLAGGFRELGPGGEGIGHLSTTELYDPSTGGFTAGPEMCGADGACVPRAFAAAVTLQDGRVMLTGGQNQPEQEGAGLRSLASAAIFDPAQAGWTLSTAMKAPRRFHTATLLSRGHVVVAGGLRSEGDVVSGSEFYDPGTGTFHEAAGVGGRAFHGAAAVGSQAVALLGGLDAGKQPTDQVTFLQWSPEEASYVFSSQTEQLSAPVFGAGVAMLRDFYVLIGGFQQFDPTGSRFHEVSSTAQFTALPSPGPDETGATTLRFPRAFPCVAPVDDGRALVVGGLDQDGNAVDGAELLTRHEGGVSAGFAGGLSASSSQMTRKRAYSTCTRFGGEGEERILITGGVGADRQATAAAEIYVIKRIGQ